MPGYACQAWNRAAEPDFEIGQERKCLRSRGQRRETPFSQSRSRGGPAPRPADCRESYRQFESRSIFMRYQRLVGGGGGIRTHGTRKGTTVFEFDDPRAALYRILPPHVPSYVDDNKRIFLAYWFGLSILFMILSLVVSGSVSIHDSLD